jgi:hypothetical protein
MRRRRFFGHLTLAATLAALSLAAIPSPATAVTIGQLAPGSPPPASCNVAALDLLNRTVGSGNSYVVPATGGISAWTVNSWSTNAAAGSGQMLKMKIFRKIADPLDYRVVGHDLRPLTGGTVNTFPVSIPVQAGDVLGLNLANAMAVPNACDFSASGRRAYHDGDLGDGEAATFSPETSDFRLNITAEVEPLNTFTLGAITRNKKKGTATLTLNVPNPGELTGSGNGVSAAGAAVISKTVSAPGQAQLLIKAKGKKKKKLNRKGRVKLTVAIAYTPTGGDPSSQSIKVKLKKKLMKR